MASRRNQRRATSSANLRNPSPPPPIAPPQMDTLGIEFRDQEFLQNFLRLSARPIRPTRFYDVTASQELYVDGDVAQLFHQVGWDNWLNLHALTYKRLTLEFLSTLTVLRSEGSGNPRNISFQLMGQRYTRNIGQINDAFGWPRGGSIGPRSNKSRKFRPGAFWRQLTSRFDYVPTRSKATSLVSPGFRISHRLLASTIFARGDSLGVVAARELYFLWHMTEGDNRINPGAWFIDHLEYVSSRPSGAIAIGGMITIIAVSLGIDVAGLQVVQGETRINMRSFVSMHWLEEQEAGGYLWKVGSKDYAILPDPENTAIYDESNWVFEPDFPWAPDAEERDDPMEQDAPNQQPQPLDQQQPGYQGGWGEQMAALQTEFGYLRTDMGDLRRSHETMTTAFGQMQEQYSHMSTEFGTLRNDMHRYFSGSSSSQPGYDPNHPFGQ